jgi:hypothetical protein
MTNKQYKYAGVSTFAGKTKIRFANDIMRIKVLDKNGHTDVNIKELPGSMNKAEAVAHLSSLGFAGENDSIKAALTKAAKKYGSPKTESTPEVEAVAEAV